MDNLLDQVELVRNELLAMNTKKRILIDEIFGLEYELDKARESLSELSKLFWIERLRLDRLERTMREQLDQGQGLYQ